MVHPETTVTRADPGKMAKSNTKDGLIPALEASCKKKEFAPLYFLYGEEDFLFDEAIELIIAHAVDETTKGFNLDMLYGSAVEAKDVVTLLSQFPMMAERRVVVLKEVDKIANKDLLLPLIEHPVASTIAVFTTSSKPDFRLKFFKALQQHAEVFECKPLYENQIPGWIADRVRKLGKRITPEASQMMQAQVGNSLREIQNEITKLFIFVGEKEEVGIDDVTRIVGMSKEYNVFELEKKLGAKALAPALEILQHMLDAGESAIGIVVQLTRYFQKLWLLQELQSRKVDDAQIASLLRVGPFFLREYRDAARTYSSGEIESAFQGLLEADQRLKLSGDPVTVMTLLIVQIVRGIEVRSHAAVSVPT